MKSTSTITSTATTTAAALSPIARALERFVAGFNSNDLDEVMKFFADDAVYRPGDGQEHRGKERIRAAFAPQFSGVFGQMHFEVHDRLVDERARKATIRWTCTHDLGGAAGGRVPLPQRWLYRLLYGRRCNWYGTDTFHFDSTGRITGKFTYSGFKRPLLHRGLAARTS